MLAVEGLLEKGENAIKKALALVDDPDWKVRSSVCQMIGKAQSAVSRGELEVDVLMRDQIPMLIDFLHDPHYWVRTQAAVSLRAFDDAPEAVPALLQCMSDQNDWVRLEAMRSLKDLGANPTDMVQAALEVLGDHTYSAYRLPRMAFDVLKDADDVEIPRGEKLTVLLNLLSNPPEGDGRFLLNQVMDYAVTLDPSGERLIPVLIDAAADKTHLSRIRQNPRGHAIEVLGQYGSKATAAIPVLQDILDSESDKNWHETAKEALSLILGKDE
jgi:HEAT repeat protein